MNTYDDQENLKEPRADVLPVDDKKFHRKNIFTTNLYFVLLTAAFLILAPIVQGRNFKTGILITHYGLLLGSSLLFIKLRGGKIKETIRLKSVKFTVYLRVFFANVLMIPVVAGLNLLVLTLIHLFGTPRIMEIPTASDSQGFVLLLFIIAITAGICEEVVFRGALLPFYEKSMGRRKAAFLTALLFGIFHFNPANLLGPIVLGLIFAYVVQVTGSILPAIFGHFVNNGVAVTMGYIANKVAQLNLEKYGDLASTNDTELTNSQLIGILLPLLVVGIVCFIIARILLKSLKKTYPKRQSELYEGPVDERDDYLNPDYTLWGRQKHQSHWSTPAMIVLLFALYSWLGYMVLFGGR